MKRFLTILSALLFIGFLATHSLAGHGHGKNNQGSTEQNTTAQYDQNRTQFMQETKQTRTELHQARSELHNLLQQENPDKNRIRELNSKIAELKTELQLKAKEYGMSYGRKHGMHGQRMKGHSPQNRPCRNQ